MTGKNAFLTAACTGLILGFALSGSPVHAQVAAIQTQDINLPGFAAEFIEAKRSDGMLSIKVRTKNTGAKDGTVHFTFGHNIDEFYIQAEGKKYFVLRDTEKVPIANATPYTNVAAGASFTWWAKFPAPPANVKKFNFYWPLGAPFDDVPITDK